MSVLLAFHGRGDVTARGRYRVQCFACFVALGSGHGEVYGQLRDLRRIYIFVTSNLGGAEILGREHLPFVTLEKYVTRCVRRHLRPELVARFGAPLVFRPLNRGVQTEIAATKLDELIDWNRQQGREISCEDGVVRLLVQRGFSPELGARPLLDTIEELAGDAIVEQLLAGGHGHGRLATNGTLLRLKP